MNKLFTKIATAFVGMAMAVGVGVALGSNNGAREVRATIDDSTQYSLINSVESLEAGKSYIITNGTSGTVKAIAVTTNTNNRKTTEVTVSDGKITRGSSVMSFTLGGSSGAWTFATENYAGDAGYLASAQSGNNNYLRVIATAGTATISFSGDQAVINIGPHDSRTQIRYNASNLFACYASGQSPVYLWKEVDASIPSFTLDKTTVELAVGGESATVTATPNAAVSPSATYSWSVTAGDDCVTLTNANTATVTIAPKGSLFAGCTITISVTGCESKNLSVIVKRSSSAVNPFTVAEAKKVIDLGSTEDKQGVYVHGIISQVDSFNDKYGSITYWISDDGATEGQFEVYGGLGLSGAEFNSIDELQVGYEVIVNGSIKLYNTTYEFDANNTLSSLVIPGAHSVSTTTEGLTLNTDSVGESGSVTLTTASKKKGTDVVVTGATSSVSGNVVTLSEVTSDVTINATIVDAEIASLAVSGQKTKFSLEDDFTFGEGTLTATYDDWCSPHTEEPILVAFPIDASKFQKGKEGTYEITINYGGASVSYNVTVSDIFNPSKGEYHIANQSDIVDGANIAIAAAEADVVMAEYADGNNFPSGEGAKDDVTGTVAKANAVNLTLVAGTGDYVGYFMMKLADDKVLYAAGGTGGSPKNQLKASSTITPDDRFYFSFVKVSDTDWTITAKGGATRDTVRYNSTDNLFSCYASGGQAAITVYSFVKYSTEVASYSETFIKGSGNAGTCAATKSAWSTLETAYGKLTDGAKAIFKNATHESADHYTNNEDYSLEHVVARYDLVIVTYGTGTFHDFMARNPSPSQGSRVGGSSITSSTNNIIIIVVAASVLSLAAVSGCLLLRRRKHK